MTTTLTLTDDLRVPLTRDHDRIDFYVDLPLTGLSDAAQAAALSRELRSHGLEAMTDDECPWDFTDKGVRVYCAEVAAA